MLTSALAIIAAIWGGLVKGGNVLGALVPIVRDIIAWDNARVARNVAAATASKADAVAARDAEDDALIQADAIASRSRQQVAQQLVYQQNEAARLALAREQADNPPAPAQFKPPVLP